MHESVGTLSETRAQLDRLSWTTRRSITWSNARSYICSNNHRTWLWGTCVIINELYFCLCLPQSPRWLRRMERSYSAGDFNAWNEWRDSAGDFDAWNERRGGAVTQVTSMRGQSSTCGFYKSPQEKAISNQTFKHLRVCQRFQMKNMFRKRCLCLNFLKRCFFTLHYGKSYNDLIRICFWCEK